MESRNRFSRSIYIGGPLRRLALFATHQESALRLNYSQSGVFHRWRVVDWHGFSKSVFGSLHGRRLGPSFETHRLRDAAQDEGRRGC